MDMWSSFGFNISYYWKRKYMSWLELTKQVLFVEYIFLKKSEIPLCHNEYPVTVHSHSIVPF